MFNVCWFDVGYANFIVKNSPRKKFSAHPYMWKYLLTFLRR